MTTHRLEVLANGTRLLTAPMAERVSASIAFMVDVGSRHEDRDSAGLAHFLEHMVFKGAGRRPTARAISEAIEGVGGSLNAETDRELTVYWAQVPAEHLELALGVLADMVFRPVLDVGELVKERLVVVEELRMAGDNPQDRVHTLFDEVLWPDHPLGWDVAGREDSVLGFDRDACLRQCDLHHRPDHLVVSVAGAIDPDRVGELLERELGEVTTGRPRPEPRVAEPVQPGGRLQVERRDTEQANMVIGGRAASYADPDRHAVDLLNAVLGDGMSSRLFVELREEQALAYDVHSFTTRLRDSGSLAMYIGCDPGRAKQAVIAAIAELTKLAETPVPDAELGRAREYLRGRLLLGLESTAGVASHLGQQQLLTGQIATPEEVAARIDAVSAADVQRAAAGVLESGLRAAVVGPFAEPSALEAAFRREAA